MAGRRKILQGFQERLICAWQNSGMAKAQLATKIGVERKSVYGYINDSHSPDVLTLAKICVALNVSADWLLFGKSGYINDEERIKSAPLSQQRN